MVQIFHFYAITFIIFPGKVEIKKTINGTTIIVFNWMNETYLLAEMVY